MSIALALAGMGLSSAVIAVIIALTTKGGRIDQLQALVDAALSSDLAVAVRGYTDLRKYITEITDAYKTSIAEITAEVDYADTQAEANDRIAEKVLDTISVGHFPAFTTAQAVVDYYNAIHDAYFSAFTDYQVYLLEFNWANQEYMRLAGRSISSSPGAEIELEALPAELPTFSTVEAAQSWYDFYASENALGRLDRGDYLRIYNHYAAEYDRLVAPVAEPKPGVVIETGAIQVNVTPKIEAVLPEGAVVVNNTLPEVKVPAIDLTGFASATTDVLKAIADADLKAKDDIGKNLAQALDALSRAQAAAAAQAGAQVAAGSQAAAATQAAATTQSSAALAAAVGALGLAAATEFAKIAKTWGHDTASGARGCWASTAASLFEQIAGAAVPLTLAIAGDKFSPIRDAQNALMERVFNEIWSAPELSSPISPESTPAVAAALFRKAFEIGQLAHLLSVLAEVVTPLKTLGLGQVAAFLADMSGFAKIGGAMMGAIESQGLARPFGFYINAKTLTNRPDLGQLLSLAGEYVISRAEFNSEAAYRGFPKAWAEKLYELADRPLQPRLLSQMAEAGIADEEFFEFELRNGAYNEKTIPKLQEMFRLASLGELKPTGDTLARKRYKEGLTNDAQLSGELLDLGYRGQKLGKATQLAQLDRQTDLLLDKLTLIRTAYLADDLTEQQMRDQVASVITDKERATGIIDLNISKYRPPRLPDRLPRLREALASAYVDNVERGYKPSAAIKPMLTGLGYSSAEADAALERAELAHAQSVFADKIKIGEEKYIDKELTLDQLRVYYLDLGLAPTEVGVKVELARLRAQPTPRAPTVEEIPTLSTAYLLAAFRAGTITEAQLRLELAERLYQPEDINIMISQEKAKEPKPTATKQKTLSEAQLRAMFAAGLISVADYAAALKFKGYADLDVQRIINLESIKAEAKQKT